VKELRKTNPEKTVVVAFALYLKSSRDYIRKITGEPVSFVQFKVTEDEIVARNKHRVT
jgi:gluconate kinase